VSIKTRKVSGVSEEILFTHLQACSKAAPTRSDSKKSWERA
jgi:hypothetical protein